MRRHLLILFLLLAGLVEAVPALAQQSVRRFPPPDFTDHKLPQTTTPLPRPDWQSWMDVAVLASTLALASYLALKRRSRKGVLAMTLFAIGYFGIFRAGCICPVGSIQNVALAAAELGYALPLAVLAIFLLPLVATLLVGRTFCGGVCPLGAIQDVVLIRPLTLPAWLEQSLGLLPYLYLGSAVVLAGLADYFLICQFDPFVGFYRIGHAAFATSAQAVLALLHVSPPAWLAQAPQANPASPVVLLGASLLAIAMFVGRPYCRFLCPYGAILRCLSWSCKWHVTITPGRCVNCRLCENACPFGAIRVPTPDRTGRPRREGKMALAAALLAWPALAIGLGWAGSGLGDRLGEGSHTIRLARRIAAEQAGLVQGTTNDSDAFRRGGEPVEKLLSQAGGLQRQFALGGWGIGGLMGLVVGGKLVQLSVRRRRVEHEIDRGLCLSCGRCFRACPIQRQQDRSAGVSVGEHESRQ